jgi:hypothetical protein
MAPSWPFLRLQIRHEYLRYSVEIAGLVPFGLQVKLSRAYSKLIPRGRVVSTDWLPGEDLGLLRKPRGAAAPIPQFLTALLDRVPTRTVGQAS